MTSKNMGICPYTISPSRIVAALLLALAIVLQLRTPVSAQELPSAEKATEGLNRIEGFVDVFWDDQQGKVLIEIDENDGPFIYHAALAGGLGSNDVGLDRGLLGPTKLVRFRRIGKKVLLFEENTRYRADSENPDERLAVDDAFAPSIVHGFDVVGRSGSRLVLDATSFVVRDAMGLAKTLADAGQGQFTLDASRSAVNPDVVRSFPSNTELEAFLTFSGGDPGRFVRDVAADPSSVTLRIRHSLVALPDDDYTPRAFDPRAGYFGITYVDYSTPISAEKERRFISRHRVTVRDGKVVEPIVYYLDRGVPEPIRSALLEGAGWWSEAFAAAGLPDAFRVELLPEGVDALDIRYNAIQWVHRATRGWSWGDVVVDPRTGEIIKGYVALGSLRVRQDYLIAESLLGSPGGDGSEDDDPALRPALARIRQLAAHEVGHTLGLQHNFAASLAGRASVMDYPAPLVFVNESGAFDHDRAYGVGIGEYDKYAIRYGYTIFNGDETAGLNQIIGERRNAGIQYITDEDARPAGGAHPGAHLWDNGENVLEGLEAEMTLRRRGLAAFGLDRLPAGRPVATLEDVLVPLYLRHRYQLEAATKLVAGVWYEYEIVGEPSNHVRPVDESTQRRALAEVLAALDPAELRIPESVRSVLPPRPPGYPATRELFSGETGLTFDAVSPAGALADFVFGLLIQPERAARLAYQKMDHPSLPGLDEVLGTISGAVFAGPADTADAYDRALTRTVQDRWVTALIRLASTSYAADVASQVQSELGRLATNLAESGGSDLAEQAHTERLAARIDRFLLRPYKESDGPQPVEMPPGSPIGSSKN